MNRAQNTRMLGELSGALPKSWRKSVLAKLCGLSGIITEAGIFTKS